MRTLKCTVAGGVLLVLGACSSSAQAPKQMATSDVVAMIGSTPITLGEVDDRAFQRSTADFGGARLVQALYLARREDYDAFKRVRHDVFSPPYPASTAIVAGGFLFDGMLVEIDAVARVGEART